MGINDFGGANDPLANPPLGGPNGWAASVRDAVVALQGQHTVRSTRPNGTDHLIEVFDGTAWNLVSYDSGWRDVSGSLTFINGWTVDAGWPAVIKRSLDMVHIKFRFDGTHATDYPAATMPPGFRPASAGFTPLFLATVRAATYLPPVEIAPEGQITVWAGYGADKNSLAITASYATSDPVPASLPGTLATTAP